MFRDLASFFEKAVRGRGLIEIKPEDFSVNAFCQIFPSSFLLKRGILFGVILLAGCTTQSPQFSTPEKITFQNQAFERVTHTQLDDMQQMLYLPSEGSKDPENWDKGLLIFLDKNSREQTLEERAELRKKAFAQQAQTQAIVEIRNQELHSQVIYPPTERFKNVQLEVSRGKDFACGFGQIQLADKRSVSHKKLQNLSQFQPLATSLAQQLAQLAWQIECK